MSVQIFLMAGGTHRAKSLDIDQLGECSAIYEFNDMNGPRRWDAFEWGQGLMRGERLPFDGIVSVRLDRSALEILFHDLAETINDADWQGYDESDKANRLAKDQAGLEAALAYLSADHTRSIYLYGAA